jgi:acetolactate synthase-1/2/3 large subunit
MVEAFGARGFSVATGETLDETLRAALGYDGPAVVDAHVDPARMSTQ